MAKLRWGCAPRVELLRPALHLLFHTCLHRWFTLPPYSPNPYPQVPLITSAPEHDVM